MPSGNPTEDVSAGRGRLSAVAARAVAVLVAMSAALLIGAAPAHAVGDPNLSKLIISDPEPGWSDLPSTETNNLQTQLQTEFQRLESQNQTYSTAVAGWQSPQGTSSDSLVVFIVESIGGSRQSLPAASVTSGFCSGATNTNSVPTPPIPNVPDSAIATCSDTTQKVTVGTATKGNLIELIASFGSSPLGEPAVEQVVGDQLDALPGSTSSSSTPSSSGGGGSDAAIIIGGAGGGGVIVVGGVIAFILLRRKRSNVAVAAAGHPAPGSAPPPPGLLADPALAGLPADPGPAGHPGDPGLTGLPDLPGHDPWRVADPGWVSSLDATTPAVHHADASAGSAPGWYPEGGDAETLRYWDGTTFTSRRRWNGSEWVEA
jgi:hypothetical protein